MNRVAFLTALLWTGPLNSDESFVKGRDSGARNVCARDPCVY